MSFYPQFFVARHDPDSVHPSEALSCNMVNPTPSCSPGPFIYLFFPVQEETPSPSHVPILFLFSSTPTALDVGDSVRNTRQWHLFLNVSVLSYCYLLVP